MRRRNYWICEEPDLQLQFAMSINVTIPDWDANEMTHNTDLIVVEYCRVT